MHNTTYGVRPLPEYDQDTGQPLKRPEADLYLQALNSVVSCNPTPTPPLFLPPYLRLESNPDYLSVATTTKDLSTPITGYYWTILPHPTTRQFTIGRVYT